MTKHIKSKCLNLSSKKVAVIIICILYTTQPVFFLTSLVILIKLNLIALLPNLLFFVFNKPNMTHWQVIHRVTA